MWKWSAQDFSLKQLLRFEIYAAKYEIYSYEIHEKFAYKHSETIEYVKR